MFLKRLNQIHQLCMFINWVVGKKFRYVPKHAKKYPEEKKWKTVKLEKNAFFANLINSFSSGSFSNHFWQVVGIYLETSHENFFFINLNTKHTTSSPHLGSRDSNPREGAVMLCGGRVPVEPILTTTTACGTTVESSLGSAGLPQWSQTQAYASNVYYTNLSQAV